MTKNYNILITNDDGIESPGLKAAVEAVMDIGSVSVIAPTLQQTASGRALTGNRQSSLQPIPYKANGKKISAYHCECSPALIVKHSLKTLFNGSKIDLLVSGINYGENLGVNITSSGTVGAALEAACSGIPSIAISQQTDIESHFKYTDQDWTTSAFFLNKFAKVLLKNELPQDVDVLKIDVPASATPLTHWKMTNLSKTDYYSRVFDHPAENSKLSDGKTIIQLQKEDLDREGDIYVFAVERLVAVTPLSVDLTSRVNIKDLKSTIE